ncbi:MAG: dTDP-glucose 4,6-dehydratase [Bacteroidetes bacterium]|nr:dTDP-glucose 4,6-dehydratase [Bacteroidota bacterium]MCH8523885.1 dTDP-glucose 4,6-dehydratase [Balneolales bacterium]
MNNKRILVTGGAGFIGSNLVLHLMKSYPGCEICNLDKLTYASDLTFLADVQSQKNYSFVQVDIVNREAVRNIIRDFRPDGVFHLAAESHVDNSISGPEPFIMSNVVGTFNLLEELRLWWTEENLFDKGRFLHVSTDEVYGSLGATGFFTEETPYAPNSPYSASKASSDMLVRAYHHTYGMNVVTTNCSNNYGPHQHDEKLIPTVIRTALAQKPIPIYGKGDNIRDWLFVGDHCKALDDVFQKGRSGETYNIGGHNEWTNIDLVRKICSLLDEMVGEGPEGGYAQLITFVKDRPGHDMRYAIDPTKIETELGWRNTQSFEDEMKKTLAWYIARYQK